MNDPNGLVYHQGLWHLYFQYNPEGADWGNMSWGHATSADLHSWTEHPVALMHRSGEQIFSGSVIAPRASGADSLTAVYTSAYNDGHQAQSIATSADGGFTWKLDPDNPILDRGTRSFRDPKVISFVDRRGKSQWILLAVEAEARQVLFYSSNDLKTWTYLSTFGPLGDEHLVWECPDLTRLLLDNNRDDPRWVLTLSTNPIGEDPDPQGSSMSYLIGDFDGIAFTTEEHQLTRLDYGRDYYAGVTFDNAPNGDAIMIGWMGNWRYAADFPSTPWRGAMSLPRYLTLRTVAGAPRLNQEPPAFLQSHLARSTPSIVWPEEPVALGLSGHSLLELKWDPTQTGTLRLLLTGDTEDHVELTHSPNTGLLTITRRGKTTEAIHPDFPSTTKIPLVTTTAGHLLVSLDGPLLEVFVNNGEATASHLMILGSGNVAATLTSECGSVVLTTVDMLEPETTPPGNSSDRAVSEPIPFLTTR